MIGFFPISGGPPPNMFGPRGGRPPYQGFPPYRGGDRREDSRHDRGTEDDFVNEPSHRAPPEEKPREDDGRPYAKKSRWGATALDPEENSKAKAAAQAIAAKLASVAPPPSAQPSSTMETLLKPEPERVPTPEPSKPPADISKIGAADVTNIIDSLYDGGSPDSSDNEDSPSSVAPKQPPSTGAQPEASEPGDELLDSTPAPVINEPNCDAMESDTQPATSNPIETAAQATSVITPAAAEEPTINDIPEMTTVVTETKPVVADTSHTSLDSETNQGAQAEIAMDTSNSPIQGASE